MRQITVYAIPAILLFNDNGPHHPTVETADIFKRTSFVKCVAECVTCVEAWRFPTAITCYDTVSSRFLVCPGNCRANFYGNRGRIEHKIVDIHLLLASCSRSSSVSRCGSSLFLYRSIRSCRSRVCWRGSSLFLNWSGSSCRTTSGQ